MKQLIFDFDLTSKKKRPSGSGSQLHDSEQITTNY